MAQHSLLFFDVGVDSPVRAVVVVCVRHVGGSHGEGLVMIGESSRLHDCVLSLPVR